MEIQLYLKFRRLPNFSQFLDMAHTKYLVQKLRIYLWTCFEHAFQMSMLFFKSSRNLTRKRWQTISELSQSRMSCNNLTMINKSIYFVAEVTAVSKSINDSTSMVEKRVFSTFLVHIS